MNFMDLLTTALVFFSIYGLAATSGLFSERSGIVNLSINGGMIIGALAYVVMSSKLIHSEEQGAIQLDLQIWMVLVSFLVAAIAAILITTLLSVAAINLNSDQTVVGTAINILAPIVAYIVLQSTFQKDNIQTGNIQILSSTLGYTSAMQPIVIVGILAGAVVLIMLAGWFVINKTTFGLRMRAAGENPHALAASGVSVKKIRHIAMIVSGMFAGLAGAVAASFAPTLSTFSNNVSGMGFVALSILIIGQWRTPWIILGAIGFSFLYSLADKMQVDFAENKWWIWMIPYASTIVVLPIVSKFSKVPKAVGIPYDKSKR